MAKKKAKPDVSVITVTHDRPRCFNLLTKYLASQDFLGSMEWIVVCDTNAEAYNQPANAKFIVRQPVENEGLSICRNYREALKHVTADKVVFFEDDEIYFETYLSWMVDRLDEVEVAGEGNARYYNLKYRQYREMGNFTHASLCQTGIRRNVIPFLEKLCDEQLDVFLDMRLWKEWKGSKQVYPYVNGVVSMKGLWGAVGLGIGHGTSLGSPDPELYKLEEWIGKDKMLNYFDKEYLGYE